MLLPFRPGRTASCNVLSLQSMSALARLSRVRCTNGIRNDGRRRHCPRGTRIGRQIAAQLACLDCAGGVGRGEGGVCAA
jgi:hypothetical protein